MLILEIAAWKLIRFAIMQGSWKSYSVIFNWFSK